VKELTLMVCPHDTVRNPEGWYRMAQYLAARLTAQIHVEGSSDFAEFRQGIASADLVYSNPTDSLSLIDAHGFCPLAHPADTYDEALLIAGPEGDLPAAEAIHGAMVATVTQLLPTRLATRALRERGITPASFAHRDSWLSVVRSVWNGEVPFGILYRDAYENLSPQGREMVRIMEATDDRAAFHMLCAQPARCGPLSTLTDLLASMGADSEGAAVLADLRIPGWLPVAEADLARLRALVA
jgi:hypothetical protein